MDVTMNELNPALNLFCFVPVSALASNGAKIQLTNDLVNETKPCIPMHCVRMTWQKSQ